MRFKNAGNKRDIIAVVVQNKSTSATIKVGGPVFLDVTTGDGVGVVPSDGLPAANQGLFRGLAITDIAPNQMGESIVHGQFDYCRLVLQTRAVSTDNWASWPALAVGDYLGFYTGSGTHAMTRTAAGAATFGPGGFVQILQSVASGTTITNTGTGTTGVNSIGALVKVFVRDL